MTATALVNSCFSAVRLQGSDFDVALRKLISETQRVSQRINKTSMVRFHSSVDLDDIVLIR